MYILFSLINVINVVAVLKSTFNRNHGSIEFKDCIEINFKVEISLNFALALEIDTVFP